LKFENPGNPIEITEEGKDKVSFQYNASLGRSNMFYGGLETNKTLRRYRKHYSGDGSMEITYDKQSNKTTFVTYLMGDAYSSPVIWHSEQSSSTTVNNYYYLHRDYLGSILAITDKEGVFKEKRHFDAWGNFVKFWNSSGVTTPPSGAGGLILDRGYTGHEHLLGVGIIHMNGRLYDPMLHRFLAPDNFVQDPFNTQNFNRYAYVLNNPLMYTDRNGEMSLRAFTSFVFGIVKVVVAALLVATVIIAPIVVGMLAAEIALGVGILAFVGTAAVVGYSAFYIAAKLDNFLNGIVERIPLPENENNFNNNLENSFIFSHYNQNQSDLFFFNRITPEEVFSLRVKNYLIKN